MSYLIKLLVSAHLVHLSLVLNAIYLFTRWLRAAVRSRTEETMQACARVGWIPGASPRTVFSLDKLIVAAACLIGYLGGNHLPQNQD